MSEGTERRTTRRALLGGLAGVTVLVVGGVVWRAWDNGAFSVGKGPAYEPWRAWREETSDGPSRIVRAAILAANAHNTQPWRFELGADSITLFADSDRNLGDFDPFRREMALSHGCALENMLEAARAEGYDAEIAATAGRLDGEVPASPVFALRLQPGAREESERYRAIAERHTHRGAYLPDKPISSDLQDEMQALVPDGGDVGLVLFDGGADRARLGESIVSATESIVADAQMSADSARWFRLNRDLVEEHRDGITLDAVGLPPLINAAAKILPAPSQEAADRQWLTATRDTHVATAPLLGMIVVDDIYDRPTALQAGRLWQRLHLWATARGLYAQPLNQPCEMVDRERRLGGATPTAEALAELTGGSGMQPTFVFRMGYAERPARLSPRRPLEAVLLEQRSTTS